MQNKHNVYAKYAKPNQTYQTKYLNQIYHTKLYCLMPMAIFYKLSQLVPSFGGQTTSTCWWDSCGVYWGLCQVANDGDKDKTLF